MLTEEEIKSEILALLPVIDMELNRPYGNEGKDHSPDYFWLRGRVDAYLKVLGIDFPRGYTTTKMIADRLNNV